MSEEKCCATCGFLLLRKHKDHATIVVAHQPYRDHGNPSTAEFNYDHNPVCFRHVLDLGEQRETLRDTMSDPVNHRELSLATIQNNGKDCDKHFPWRESFSLQAHVELERQEAFLQAQAERDRRWRQEDAKAIEKRHSRGLRVTLWAAAIGVLGTLAGVFLGWLISS